MTIAMMMRLLSGTKAIKNARLKKQIEEELMRIACHLSHWLDWCMSEDEKKQIEKLWK